MPTAENAKLQYEGGQTLVSYHALTDSGNATKFTSGSATLWSSRSGYAPVVRPNGAISGGSVGVAASGSNDVVDVTALTCYLAGVSTSVSASTDLSVSRATGTGATHMINSITVNSGGSLAVVTGAEHTAFSETRGANGGPPWIPTGSIEVAQVRLSSASAGVVTAAEIFATIGTNREVYNYPAWSEYPIGDDDNSTGYVNFTSAISEIHSDDAGSTTAPKLVYAQVYTPVFSEVTIAKDFVPPLNSRSVSSTQYYNKSVASSSQSLSQGSFTAVLDDGITDPLSTLDGEFLTFKFFPDRDKSPYILCQGYLAAPPTFPADDQITSSCTISSELEAVRRAS